MAILHLYTYLFLISRELFEGLDGFYSSPLDGSPGFDSVKPYAVNYQVFDISCNSCQVYHRAANLTRIRESILAMIRVASRHENQVFSLNRTVNVTVDSYFDSCKFRPICTPVSHYIKIIMYFKSGGFQFQSDLFCSEILPRKVHHIATNNFDNL